jgi:hypothetical protein
MQRFDDVTDQACHHQHERAEMSTIGWVRPPYDDAAEVPDGDASRCSRVLALSMSRVRPFLASNSCRLLDHRPY